MNMYRSNGLWEEAYRVRSPGHTGGTSVPLSHSQVTHSGLAVGIFEKCPHRWAKFHIQYEGFLNYLRSVFGP